MAYLLLLTMLLVWTSVCLSDDGRDDGWDDMDEPYDIWGRPVSKEEAIAYFKTLDAKEKEGKLFFPCTQMVICFTLKVHCVAIERQTNFI